MRDRATSPTYVYIVRELNRSTIKVGISIDPIARRQVMQSGNSVFLDLIYVIGPMENQFAIELEREIHKAAEDFHVNGEWFHEVCLQGFQNKDHDYLCMAIQEKRYWSDGAEEVMQKWASVRDQRYTPFKLKFDITKINGFSAARNNNTEKNLLVKTAFDRWYKVYPKKKAKQDGLKAFTSRTKTFDEGEINMFVDRLIRDTEGRKAKDADWIKDNGQFVPLPATYLRGERWTDSITPVSNEANGGLPASRRDIEKIAVRKGLHRPGDSPQHLSDDHAYRQWVTGKLRCHTGPDC